MIELAKNNKLLTQPTEDFNFDDPQIDPKELSDTLVSHIDHYNAAGLSASQIGYNLSVFALNSQPRFVCYNPSITFESDETETIEEYDVSYPGLVVKVKRPKIIRVRFYDPNGTIGIQKFSGLTARYFLHQYDYLQGITFLDRANRFHKEAAIKKLTKKQKYINIEDIRKKENDEYELKMVVKETV